MNNLTIRRYGLLSGNPLVETSVWKYMGAVSQDPRCISLEGQPGSWFLLSITDNFIDMDAVEKIYAPDGSYTIPETSDFWTPYVLPLKAGVSLISKQDYIDQVNSVYASSPEVIAKLLSDIGA